MKTFGFVDARAGIERWAFDVETAEADQLAVLAQSLYYWVMTEHPWHPDRPHTEGTTAVEISDLAAAIVAVRVDVDLDAALWLELTRNGKWSWIHQVMINHLADIQAIMSGAVVTPYEENPALDDEYETAETAMSEAGHSVPRRTEMFRRFELERKFKAF